MNLAFNRAKRGNMPELPEVETTIPNLNKIKRSWVGPLLMFGRILLKVGIYLKFNNKKL